MAELENDTELELELEGEQGDDAAPDRAEPAGGLTCSECGETFTSSMQLGGHRWAKHRIRSSTPGRKRGRRAEAGGMDEGGDEPARRGPGRPRKDGSPARSRSSSTTKQERRRKAVRETLLELTSFTDELKGSGLPPEDLAGVIRRDADKIANSVAWAAERLTPLGQLIDRAMGHGGAITIGRGFLGIGTWLLRSWRQVLAERAAEPEELTAEQLAEQMQAQYGSNQEIGSEFLHV